MEFEIRSPKWTYIALLIFVIFGALLSLTGLILRILISTLFDLCLIIGIIFVLIGLVGVYSYHTEVFRLKDDVFYYNKPFKRNQQARVEEIAKVQVSYVSPILVNVEFLNAQGKKLINFYDDGTAFKGEYLDKSLKFYHIPFHINF